MPSTISGQAWFAVACPLASAALAHTWAEAFLPPRQPPPPPLGPYSGPSRCSALRLLGPGPRYSSSEFSTWSMVLLRVLQNTKLPSDAAVVPTSTKSRGVLRVEKIT